MLEAAHQENLDVDRLSFTGCLQILQARLPGCDSTTSQGLNRWYQLLMTEMAQHKLEPRRNRVNPRLVKRKMSKFAKKRAEHRGRPILEESLFRDCVYYLMSGIGLSPIEYGVRRTSQGSIENHGYEPALPG